ncbi:IgGFc-binding protein, partial [Natronospira sp.]|uniref:IgGFc-binding protein n=1 Tax=Natronospira sp. TaxID=2024970 RepID=UPI0038735B7C
MSLNPVQAQTDTEFWFAVPRVTEGHGWDDNSFYFRFTNLDQPNQVFITMPANPDFDPIEVNMDPNEALTVDVTDQIQELWTTNPDQIYNRGIQIIASELTTAYFEVGTFYNPDIFSLKGKNALGEEFFVPFQNRVENGDQYDPSPYSAIYIVATQDNTTITVTPTNDAFPGRPAGVPFDLVLDRGETIAVAPDDYAGDGQLPENRLGGTRVESDKPIAITTSDDSVYGITGCYDLIGDQIIPTSIIGTEYIAMKGELTAPEYFYVVGTQEGTEVLIDGNLEALIEPGEQLRWEFTKQNYHIETSKPAYVYHVAGFGCEQGGAVLPPIDVCTGSTSVSFTRSKGESFFLNILVRAGAQDGFIFNGDGPNTVIEAADFEAVPGSANWLAAEFEMTQAQVPVGEATLIENEKDVFHLGIINGGPSSGTMYGYFSDFNELDISANVSGTGSNHKACFGVPIQLEAFGGTEYQWHPPDYLDDPTSPTPIALPDSSIKYTVTVSGACQMVDSSSVFIHLHGPALAAFTIDEPAGCAPFDLVVNNESYGINHYSWSMGDGTVYTT